uniref:Protein KTI12 homolog n=2 Tax=Parascaris univalens TaxID=6257 RepID=A0A915BMH5_PARUN
YLSDPHKIPSNKGPYRRNLVRLSIFSHSFAYFRIKFRMPLLLLSGGPSSGKTTIAERIVEYSKSRGFHAVERIADECNGNFSRNIYNNSKKEREQRDFLRSAVERRLIKDRLIICDSLNYIKGFRYELFCVGKLIQTTFAVVFCDANAQTSKSLNSQKDEKERYEEGKIDDILMRFERPDRKNRWDSPLFTIRIIGNCEEENGDAAGLPRSVMIPFEEIFNSLLKGKALSANLSTQSASLASSNYLHDLDRTTQQIVSEVFQKQEITSPEGSFTMPYCENDDNRAIFDRRWTLPELTRLRRQFIVYMKMHPIEEKDKIASLFVNYLCSNA